MRVSLPARPDAKSHSKGQPELSASYTSHPEWRSALGIEDSSWAGIGKHLGALVSEALGKGQMCSCDLTNLLRAKGNQYIEPIFVDDYLSGKASFGCFFFQIAADLGIKAADIFKGVTAEQAEFNLPFFKAYLADVRNQDALASLLVHKPGDELRKHVRELLSQKREECINTCSHSFTVGLSSNPDKFEVGLAKVVGSVLGDRSSLLSPNTFLLNAAQISGGKLELHGDQAFKQIAQYVNGMVQSGSAHSSLIDPDARLVLQPAMMRGNRGYTIDVFPSPATVDALASGVELNKRINPTGKADSLAIGAEGWKEAFTKGTFSAVTDVQAIHNLLVCLGLCMEDLVPTRQPTAAERYELHQRWILAGGSYRAGTHVDGPGEVERRRLEKPDPLGRSTFEEQAFQANSSLVSTLGLFHLLPELVADKK